MENRSSIHRWPDATNSTRSAKMGTMQLHPSAQTVQDALDAASAHDADGHPCLVRVLPDAVHTAAAAAAALGVEVGQIANSLIFDADGEPLLVLTSGRAPGRHRQGAPGSSAPSRPPGHPGVRPRAHRPGDRRGRAAGPPQAGPHARRHRA